jgi:hypothetical protein
MKKGIGRMDNKHILWGLGGFGRDSWKALYTIIKEYDIKTVLEYGCGVSTELMMAVGCKVLSLESQGAYAQIPEANIMGYNYPEFPVLDESYDLAVIDGPGAKEFEVRGIQPERTYSAKHAIKYAKRYIYIHDGGLGQEKAFDGNPEWELIHGINQVGYQDIIYRRR